jgi:amino acid transporter
MWPVAVVYGRLGRAFAEDGGPYVWARAAFGPLTGFSFGWLTYLSSLLSAAAVLSGLGQHLAALFGLPQARLFSLACLLSLVLFASLGLRLSALSLRTVTLLKILPLLVLIALGLGTLLPATAHSAPPVLPWGEPLGRATLLVVFALQGFEVVPVLAGRATSTRHVQRATLASLFLCALLYALLQVVCANALAGQPSQGAPLLHAASALAGPFAMRLLAAGQLISALGIAFGQVVTTPYYLAVLGKPEGLGAWLGRTRTNGVPQRALLLTALFLAGLVVVQQLGSLFVLSSVAVLAQYGVAACSLFWLSRTSSDGRLSSALWSLTALVTSALLASYASASELWTTLAVEAAGIALLLTLRTLRARR